MPCWGLESESEPETNPKISHHLIMTMKPFIGKRIYQINYKFLKLCFLSVWPFLHDQLPTGMSREQVIAHMAGRQNVNFGIPFRRKFMYLLNIINNHVLSNLLPLQLVYILCAVQEEL